MVSYGKNNIVMGKKSPQIETTYFFSFCAVFLLYDTIKSLIFSRAPLSDKCSNLENKNKSIVFIPAV